VGVDRPGDVLEPRAHFERQPEGRRQLRNAGADRLHREDQVIVGARDDAHEARLRLPAAIVDAEVRPVAIEIQLFEREAVGGRPTADGDQDAVGGQALGARARLDRELAVGGRALDRRAEPQLHAQRREPLRDRTSEFGVVLRQDARCEIDHRHLRAELREGRSQLDADIACTDDDQTRRKLAHRQQLGGRDDVAAERQHRQLDRT